MKRNHTAICLALGAAVGLVACSSKSPTAPPPSPTPAAYSITLDSAASSGEVNTGILFTAHVTSGGKAVADNTSVTFTTDFGCFADQLPANASQCVKELTRTTSGGVATATLFALAEGDVKVTARVAGASIDKSVHYYQPTSPHKLAAYSITPNRGRPEGGQQVTISGRGFVTPVTVDFVIGGTVRHAQVLSVNADGSQIAAVTPATGLDQNVEQIASILVSAAVGTANQASDTLVNAFTYDKQYAGPQIYYLDPARGAYSGGEQVTIYGANFFAPVEVSFGTEAAQVASVSGDYSKVVVLTPRHQNRLTAEQQVNVTVTTRGETTQQQQVTLTNGFTWVPDSGVPLLYSANPARGSSRGGDQVILIGKNFQAPVQVDFLPGSPLSGVLNAKVVSVNSDGTQIIITTPQASPDPVTQEVQVSIRITNLVGSNLSQNATFQNVFTYESQTGAVLIYSLTPNRGNPAGGDQVVILGRGFTVQPVNVDFLVNGVTRPAQVRSVSTQGDQITVLTPSSGLDATTERIADVRVTVGTGTPQAVSVTLPASFTFNKMFAQPTIYSIEPPTGSYFGGEQVTIYGSGFYPPVTVSFGAENAQVVSVSADNSRILLLTPHHNVTLAQQLTVDVTVNTSFETAQQQQVVRAGGFTYLPDYGIPIVYSIQPSHGSPRGGDTVTLTGRNFKGATVLFQIGAPLNVARDAKVTSINADGSQLQLLTPQASPDPVTSNALVTIVITTPAGSATFSNVFTYDAESQLAIYSVSPNRGRPEGGDTVQIFGRGFIQPVRVDFVVQGSPRQALIQNSTGTTITVTTPATGVDSTTEQVADVKVTIAAGTSTQVADTLVSAFTYEQRFSGPQIYSVTPNRGSYTGGEAVTIYGVNFFQQVRVQFGNEDAQVVSVRADNAAISVLTPRHPGTHINQEQPVAVTVFTNNDKASVQQTSLANGFTYVPDSGLPLLYSVVPDHGSPRGGETVTVNGANFIGTMGVVFNLGGPLNIDLAGQVTQVSSDGHTMTVVTPRASPTAVTANVVCALTLTNQVGTANSQTARYQGVFTYDAEGTPLQIFSVVPTRGNPNGNEQVVIYGKGFNVKPVTVNFVFAGSTRPAQVLSVATDGSQITVLTPSTGLDTTTEQIASIQVTIAAGTSGETQTTLPAAFTFNKRYPAPAIYSLSPSRGAYAGGEQVIIYGANFFAPVTVSFGAEQAQVASISTDNSQITVLTPRHVGTHITQEQLVNVTVVTLNETAQQQQAVLANGFTYVPDSGVPLLYSVSPNNGSPRGGDSVLIKGSNFFPQMKVVFNLGAPLGTSLTAQVVSVSADNTQVVVITPQASPTPVTTPVVCSITLTNQVGSANSLSATYSNVFTFNSESAPLLIYSVVPNKGNPNGGDTVTILGRGFAAPPVNVDFIIGGTARPGHVTSVSSDGSAITVVTPATGLDTNVEQVADVRVTVAAATAQQLQVTLPASFTYQKKFAGPQIYSLSPSRGSYAGGDSVVIYGVNFFPTAKVLFGTEVAQLVSVSSDNTQITVLTPKHVGTHITQEQIVDVTVITNLETAQQQQTVLNAGFTWVPDSNVPLLYSVTPSTGTPRGGDTVVIKGANFFPPMKVVFNLGAPFGTSLTAQVVSVSADNTQVVITTPQVSPTPVTTPVVCSITLTNQVGSSYSLSGTYSNVFTFNSESAPLLVYSVTPNRGSPDGGNTVTVLGRGFAAPPVNVDFIIGGAVRAGQVQNVSSDGTSITVVTPATGLDTNVEQVADVRVTVAAATAQQLQATLLASFTYERRYSGPQIYSLGPGRGSYTGGEQVVIYGVNFFPTVKVLFGAEVAQLVSVSADNSQITVLTPRHPGAHINQEQPVDVTVITKLETAQQQQTTLAGGFIYVPDSGVPLLYTVTPARGTPRGGDTVIIKGANFFPTMKVVFNLGAPLNTSLTAQVVSVSADNSQIAVITPQASPTPVTTPVVCSITLTNQVGTPNTLSATYSNVFTYDSESAPLLVYSVTPNRGRPDGGDTVTVLGRGFAAPPVNVDFIIGGVARPGQVVSVTPDGSAITVVTPATGLNTNVEQVADVRVTVAAATAQQLQATLAASFTYEIRYSGPRIYSLSPGRGSYLGGEQVVIYGANFFPTVKVLFGAEEAQVASVSADNTQVTVLTPRHPGAHITQEQPVDVTVITKLETAQQQQATLAGGFIYVPDSGVPLLYTVTPSNGTPRGGDTVVIKGANLFPTMKVVFNLGAPLNTSLVAQVVTVSADAKQVTVLTPQASPTPVTTPVVCSITLTNQVGGPYTQSATYANVFTYDSESSPLRIYSITPNRGNPVGGDSVVIAGRGFAAPPVTVDFIIGGTVRPGNVTSVSSDGTSITVTTPATGLDTNIEQVADVRVTVATGTAQQLQTTLPTSFTFVKQYFTPQIYTVAPAKGSYVGNETVVIYGAYFYAPIRVTFGAEDATVVSVSSDLTQITVRTPQHPTGLLNQEQVVDVTVYTRYQSLQQQQATLTAGFTFLPNTGVPLLYSVVPSRGSSAGGDTITLTGLNFTPPVTVLFNLGAPYSGSLQATIVSVSTDGTQIVLTTPVPSPTPVLTDILCSLTITNQVGSARTQTATYPGVFTYEGEQRAPLIYYLAPSQGSARGGDDVVIYGRYFIPPIRVQFTMNGTGVVGTAQVTSVSDDGTQIFIKTPPSQVDPLPADTYAAVTVTSEYSTQRDQTVTMTRAYLYLAEQPTPQVFALSPNSGPVEGGTRITITGSGFQYPVQVLFGLLQAQVVTSNFNQVVCIAPSITPTGPTSPSTVVDVTVVNVTTGKVSNALPYTYGLALFISSVQPDQGPDIGGTTVTLFGQGFAAPVEVDLNGTQAQILSVSGTEIVVRSNAPGERTCQTATGPVKVTNINSNLSVNGPPWTYTPAHPLLISAEVFLNGTTTGANIIQQHDPNGITACQTTPAYSAYTVTLHGQNFEKRPGSTLSAMTVLFENPAVEVTTTFVDSNTITFQLPDLAKTILDQAACTTNGVAGLRDIATGLALTVKNNNNGCTDRLNPALIINPCDPTCRTGAVQVSLSPSTLNLGVGTTATMTVCLSSVQTTPTLVNITQSGSAGVIGFTPNGIGVPGATISVSIPASTPCATFVVHGLTGGGPVAVVATLPITLGGGTATAQVSVGQLGITLTPASLNLPIGGNGNLTISLSSPAPTGGAKITVAQAGPAGKIDFTWTEPPAPNPFPGTTHSNVGTFIVYIPQGASTFLFQVNALTAGGPVNVSATLDPALGGASAASQVFVGQYTVTLSPTSINLPVNGTASFTVTINAPAYAFTTYNGIQGIPVAITQTGPGGVITFTYDDDGPGSHVNQTGTTGQVFIPVGLQSATFTVNGASAGGPVTVTVTLPSGVGGASAASTVTVQTYTVTLAPKSINLAPQGVGVLAVTLNAPVPLTAINPVKVFLTLTGPAGIVKLQDNSSVDLPAPPNNYISVALGNISETFHVVGLIQGGPVTITAQLDPTLGVSADTASATVTNLAIAPTPAALTVPVGGSGSFVLTLSGPAPTNINVTLSGFNASVATVTDAPPDFTTGSTSSNAFTVTGVNVGTTTIYAQLPAAYGGGTASIQVNVVNGITLTPNSLSVPVNGTATITATLASSPAVAVNVTLTSSGSPNGALQINGGGIVTIPAGQNSANFTVTGLLPSIGPIVLTATVPLAGLPPGLAGATASASITIIGNSISVSPAALTIPPGNSGTFIVNLGQAAGAGGVLVTLSSNNPSVATVGPSITIPQGSTASTPITVSGVAQGTATITAKLPDALGGGTATVAVSVQPYTLVASPASITVGTGDDGLATLTMTPAPTSNVSVAVASLNANIASLAAPSVTILAGTTSQTFSIHGVAPGSTAVTATLPQALGGATAQINVTVQAFQLTVNPITLALGVGNSGTFTVTMSPTRGTATNVNLASANSAIANFVGGSPIQIPAGASTSAPVTVNGIAVGSTAITATLDASLGSATTQVTVNVSAYTLAAVPAAITVPMTGTNTFQVVLSTPAPVGGATITFASANPGTATVAPASIVIPQGVTTSGVITVTGVAQGGTSITATGTNIGNPTAIVPVTVIPYTLAAAPNAVSVGIQGTATVTLTIAPAPTSAVTVNLSSLSGAIATVPVTATIAAGTTTTTFTITGVAQGSTTVSASLGAALGGATAQVAVNVQPFVLTVNPAVLNVAIGNSSTFTVTLSPTRNVATVVNLVSANGSIATVGVATINIPANAPTSAPITVTGAGVGSTVVTATLNPVVGSATAQVAVNVAAYTLAANPAAMNVPVGGTNTFSVTLSSPAPAGGATLTFTPGNPAVATGPAPVPIAAGQTTTGPITVNGLALGATTMYISSTGLGGAAGQVQVSVVQGISFAPVALTVGVGGSGTFALTIAYAQPAPVTITLNGSGSPTGAVTFPATVNMPAFQVTTTFDVTGVTQTLTPYVITATLPNTGLPPGLSGATAAGQVSVIGATNNATLTLNPAPLMWFKPSVGIPSMTLGISPTQVGATTITMSSSNPIVASPPTPTLSIPGAAATLAFTPTIGNVGSTTFTATLPATLSGSPATAQVVVFDLLFAPLSLTLPAGGVGSIAMSTTTSIPAPIVVMVTSSDPTVFTVPSTVTIPAGSTVQIPITAVGPGTATISVALPASVGGDTIVAPASVTVSNITASLAPNPTTLQVLDTQNVVLTLSAAAPSASVVTLNKTVSPTTFSIPGTVTVPSGSSTVNIPVVGITGGTVGAQFTVTLPASLTTVVGPHATETLDIDYITATVTPTGTLYRNTTQTMTLAVTKAMPTNQTFTLTSSDTTRATVPASVTLPAGATTVTFVATAGTGTSGPTTITATPTTAGLVAAAPTATLTLADVSVVLTPNPMTLFPSTSGTMTATIPAALLANADVGLAVTAGVGIVTVPGLVTIPAGATSATFTVQGQASTGAATITATMPAALGGLTGTAAVNVTTPTVTLSPPSATVMAGGAVAMTVTMPSVQASPVDVTLTSNNPGNASVPAKVTIPAGSASANFYAVGESSVYGGTHLATITATLPASLGGATSTSNLTIIPLTISALPTLMNLSALTEQEVQITTGVTLAKTVTLTLASLNPVVAGTFDVSSAPTGVLQLATGSSSGTFHIRGLGIGSTSVYVSVPTSLGGHATVPPEATVAVNVLPLNLRFSASVTVPLGFTRNFTVSLTDNLGNGVAAAVPITVNFTTSDGTIAYPTATSKVIPIFANNQNVDVYGRSPGGPIVITATLPPEAGGGSATVAIGVGLPLVIPPVSLTVTPNVGDVAGGTAVTLTVPTPFFWYNATVTFGGIAATNIQQVDPRTITCNTPAHAVGPVGVLITNPDTTSAFFGAAFTYQANIAVVIAGTGTGSVASAPPGITCGPTCSANFTAATVTLTETPSGGSTFGGWSGATCPCSGTSATCNVTTDIDRSCTATFDPPPALAITCGASPNPTIQGTSVQFTSTPSGGSGTYTFAFPNGWAFGDGGTAVTQNPNHTYTTPGTYTSQVTVKDTVTTLTANCSLSVTINGIAPSFTSITPDYAPTGGWTAAPAAWHAGTLPTVVTGNNFVSGATISIGTGGQTTSYISGTQLNMTADAPGPLGGANLTITNPGGLNTGPIAGNYTYQPTLQISTSPLVTVTASTAGLGPTGTIACPASSSFPSTAACGSLFTSGTSVTLGCVGVGCALNLWGPACGTAAGLSGAFPTTVTVTADTVCTL